jgi:hypothetical protein
MLIRLMWCVSVQSNPLRVTGVLPTATAHALQVVAAVKQTGGTVEKTLPTPCRRPVHQARP